MSEESLLTLVRDALPECYSDVEFLDVGGLMAAHALFANAKRWDEALNWSECFLKVVPAAPNSAGVNTNLIRHPSRLQRLRERLGEIDESDERPPVVDFVEIAMLGNDQFLLIAMDRVTPLSHFHGNGPARITIAQRILTDLAPSGVSRWHHFDLCPRNVGIDQGGRIVLIDVESLYLLEQPEVFISVPAVKDWRVPGPIWAEIEHQLGENKLHVEADLLRRKQEFDVLLLAAEMSLEVNVPNLGTHAEAWVDEWLNAAPDSDLREVWRSELRNALEDGEVDFESIAARLAELMETGVPSVRTTAARSAKDTGEAMRNGQLGVAELLGYAQTLEQALHEDPQQWTMWRELRTLCCGYLRDPARAADVIDGALQQFPDDQEFLRWRNIVRVWLLGETDG